MIWTSCIKYGRAIFYPHIFLSFVWKDCWSGWKRLFEIDLSTLLALGVGCASRIYFSLTISFCLPKPRPETKNLSRILQQFCRSSGQIMSVTKSHLWFSPNTTRRIKEQVVGIFGIPTADHIGTYIGIPIFTTRRTANSYQYLVDKIQMKIKGWQAKYLSMACRAGPPS